MRNSNKWSKDQYRRCLQDFSKIISEDLVKIIAYYDKTYSVDNWVNEISEYLEIAKHMDLRSRDYRRYLLPWPATNKDARVWLMLFKTMRVRTGGQPDFEITKDMIEHLSKAHFYMICYFLPILSKKNDFKKQQIEDWVRKAISIQNL